MKTLLMVLVIGIVLVLGVISYQMFPQKQLVEIKSTDSYLSNVTALRSLFTWNMKDKVDYTLNLVDCEPKKYYYTNLNGHPTICYICEDTDACFSYVLVDRIGMKKISPNGLIYLKAKEFGIKNVNFYYDGLASLLNCKEDPDNSNRLECDYNVSFVNEDGKIKMVSKEENLKDLSKVICKALKSSEELNCTTNEYTGVYNCRCGEVYIQIFRGVVTYGYIV